MISYAYSLYHACIGYTYRAPMPVHFNPVATLLSLVTYTQDTCVHDFPMHAYTAIIMCIVMHIYAHCSYEPCMYH